MKAINRMGFEEATPIQAQTIPLGLSNKASSDKRKQVQVKQLRLVYPLLKKLTPSLLIFKQS